MTTSNIWLEYLVSRDRGVSIILEQRQRPGDGVGRVNVYRRPASNVTLVTFDDGAVHPVAQTHSDYDAIDGMISDISCLKMRMSENENK